MMIRRMMIGAIAGLAMTLPNAAFPQSQPGTAAEAKALLEKAAAAVKADKATALEKFDKADGGFKDRDLYVFCANSAGIAVAGPVKGKDVKTLVDKAGNHFGENFFNAAKEGVISETDRYMFPRPGGTEPVAKRSYVTAIGDLKCGVGFYE